MNNGRPRDHKRARQRVIDLVERTLPDFAQMCAGEESVILIHQGAFAADCNDEELMLLGAAIKYAGMRQKDVTMIADS